VKHLATVPVLVVLSVALCVAAGPARAEADFQFSFAGARAPDDPAVSGMRLAIFYGDNDRQNGFDLGLASVSETRRMSGFQFILGVSRVHDGMSGLASSLLNIHSGVDSGVNAAFINSVNTVRDGGNVGFVNIADGHTGFDLGGLNVSDSSKLQLGFINVTKNLEGFQFGFLNVAENGFLPFFPIFNFPRN
jgi:hypothetical protein